MALTQEELLRQQQEKLAGIAQQQQMAQQRTPGQVVGETPEQFAQGKQNYNLFRQGQTVAVPQQQTQQPQPVVQQTPQKVVTKPQPTIDPNSPTSGMDAVIANMYTSPEQEEKMRKASVANQRILALGDALRHIGNIYHTVNYAPSQQFNKPWEEEQTRYEKGKAVRDAANARYLSYQQAKAAQDAKQKQWEAQFAYTAAKDAANAQALKDYRDATLKANEERWKTQLDYRAQNDEANRKQRQKQYDRQNALRARGLSIQATNSRNAENYRQWKMKNGGGGGKGGTLTFRGANGFLSKKMSAQEANAFYNQAFEQLSNMKGANGKPIIDKNAVAGNVYPNPWGGNKINLSARKEAVDNAIYQHPEAGKLLQDMYEFELDPRGAQQTPQPVTYSSNIKFGADFWNSQKQQTPSGYSSFYTPDADDEEEYDDMLGDMDLSDFSLQ